MNRDPLWGAVPTRFPYIEMFACFLLVWGSNFTNPSGLGFPKIVLNKSLNVCVCSIQVESLLNKYSLKELITKRVCRVSSGLAGCRSGFQQPAQETILCKQMMRLKVSLKNRPRDGKIQDLIPHQKFFILYTTWAALLIISIWARLIGAFPDVSQSHTFSASLLIKTIFTFYSCFNIQRSLP